MPRLFYSIGALFVLHSLNFEGMNLKSGFCLLLLCGLVWGIAAQTRLIAYKSHSGKASLFAKTFTNEWFVADNSNFGQAPTRLVRFAELDSVVYINDTVAVMVTSKYCQYEDVDHKRLWKPGKDTVTHHPVFCKKLTIDSMRSILKKQYYFRNNMDSVKFVGYKNPVIQKPEQQQQQFNQNTNPLLPVVIKPEDPGNFPPFLWAILAVSAITSIFGALVYHQYRKIKYRYMLENPC